MKRKNNILAAMTISCVVLFTISCDPGLPYHPEQFVPPKLTIPLVSRDSIKSFLGTSSYNFKLAFTQKSDQNIYVVDFSITETDRKSNTESAQVIRLAKDVQKTSWMPDSPLLSPDGSLVTYFLRGDVANDVTSKAVYVQKTQADASPVQIARNGTDPHFFKDSTGKLSVIYSDNFKTASNSLPSVTGYSTFRQPIDPASGSTIGSRSVLVDKPFNGGLSADGRYLCTGYVDGAFYDLTGSTLFRINYSAQKVMQICNPSISPDQTHPDWMMFLQFAGVQQMGYADGITPLGSINQHEYLIIVDKTNTVQWYLKCPTDHFEWQCPEWTNEFNFVVALAKVANDDNDTRYDCCLIRRSDNALLKLTTGDFKLDNTATPSFWIGR